MPQDSPIPKIARRIVRGDQGMVAQVKLDQGFKVDTHQHENEQFACVLSGKMLFGLNDPGSDEYYEITMQAGEVLRLPSNIPHSAEALEDSVLFDIFAPPCAGMGVDQIAAREAASPST